MGVSDITEVSRKCTNMCSTSHSRLIGCLCNLYLAVTQNGDIICLSADSDGLGVLSLFVGHATVYTCLQNVCIKQQAPTPHWYCVRGPITALFQRAPDRLLWWMSWWTFHNMHSCLLCRHMHSCTRIYMGRTPFFR